MIIITNEKQREAIVTREKNGEKLKKSNSYQYDFNYNFNY